MARKRKPLSLFPSHRRNHTSEYYASLSSPKFTGPSGTGRLTDIDTYHSEHTSGPNFVEVDKTSILAGHTIARNRQAVIVQKEIVPGLVLPEIHFEDKFVPAPKKKITKTFMVRGKLVRKDMYV